MKKIKEMDDFIRKNLHLTPKIFESHPEICFYSLNGNEAMRHNKKKRDGVAERIKVLEKYFEKSAYLFQSISNQTIEEGINNFQLKARINLLVMINNKHSFFENLFFKNTINKIGFHLNIPFLVIPSKNHKT